MLSIEELINLEDEIMAVLPDKITEILTRANTKGQIEELLNMLGMSDLLGGSNTFETYKDGKIVVIGGSEVKEETLMAIGKQLGIDKRRFEFCLDYKDAQKYDYRKMQYAPQYRIVLFGPIPHSAHDKGDSSSILAELEKSEAYPRVERLISGQELKITKSNFREKLQQLIAEDYI